MIVFVGEHERLHIGVRARKHFEVCNKRPAVSLYWIWNWSNHHKTKRNLVSYADAHRSIFTGIRAARQLLPPNTKKSIISTPRCEASCWRFAHRVEKRITNGTRTNEAESDSLRLDPADVLTLRQARRKAVQIKAQAILGSDPQTDRKERRSIPTLRTFIEERYLPFVQTYKRSWRTDETVLRVHVLPQLGHLFLDEITAERLIEIVGTMRTDGYAPGTVARVVVILRYLFNLARKWKVLKGRRTQLLAYRCRRMFKEIGFWTRVKLKGWLRRSRETKIKSLQRQSYSCC